MLNIKDILDTTITESLDLFTGVERVASYPCTEDLLDDIEKVVFSNSAIGLGDVLITKNPYSVGYDINEYVVDCLLFTKSSTAETNTYTNTTVLSNLLRQNKMSQSGIVTNQLVDIGEKTAVTDRLNYRMLSLVIKEIEQV